MEQAATRKLVLRQRLANIIRQEFIICMSVVNLVFMLQSILMVNSGVVANWNFGKVEKMVLMFPK